MKPCVVIGVEGVELTPADLKRLASPIISGVILFSRNYESPAQLKKLTESIKHQNPALTIMVDQEGGRVMRFREGFSALPPLAEFGKQLDTKGASEALASARHYGALMARELLACGVDLSLSPVVDLGINQEIIGTRAFHPDPQKVVILSKAWIEGMNSAGMKSVLKHFPGHGSVKGDTHLNSLSDARSFDEILKTDLYPFVSLIQVDYIMASHVMYPSVDAVPASFSSIWLKDILRKQFGFKGIIISDDLGMQAAKFSQDPRVPIQMALTAGCDQVLLCNEFDVMDVVLSSKFF
jgi:beta-N-acetylhexosaminidase